MHVLEGFSVATRYVFVDEPTDYVCFLEETFAAREVGRSAASKGRIVHCEVRISDATLMIRETTDAPEPSAAESGSIPVTVPMEH